MRKIFLTFCGLASIAFSQSVYVNGGNLVLQNAGASIAGLQFNMTGASAAPVISSTLTSKQVSCGPTFSICLVVGNNSTAIPDGNVLSVPSGATFSNLVAVSPTGTAVTLKLVTNPCDVNGDGKIDVSDFSAIVLIANGTNQGSADINGDGKTDIFDVFRVVLSILGGVCKVGP